MRIRKLKRVVRITLRHLRLRVGRGPGRRDNHLAFVGLQRSIRILSLRTLLRIEQTFEPGPLLRPEPALLDQQIDYGGAIALIPQFANLNKLRSIDDVLAQGKHGNKQIAIIGHGSQSSGAVSRCSDDE